MGAATTPNIANIPPNLPNQVLDITLTTSAALFAVAGKDTTYSCKLPTEPKKEEAKAAPAKVVYQKTVLGEGTFFEGTLNSKGDVEIGGIFKGDIISDGNVIIHSKVEGNIKAKNLDVISNVLTGNVNVDGKVNVAPGSEIKGNINAQSIVCSGKITGDMVVSGDSSFDELSHVEGNITTKFITINHGAYIDGKLTITK